MLKDNVILPLHRRFKSGTEWEPIGFFSDSLCEAKSFDLMLGFFSSSAINILSDGFAAFLYNGGKMRMIINDILSQDDKDAIMAGEESTDLPFFDLHNLESIKHTLSERNRHFFECLSYLIRNDRLEIKVIAPKDEKGISHTKTGIFADGTNRIAFEGSCNFSKTALVDNIESFTVSCDWDGPTSKANIDEITRDFGTTFNGHNDNVKYEDVSSVKTNILSAFPDKSLMQLVKDEFNMLKQDAKSYISPSISKALKRAKEKTAEIIYKQTGDINVMLSDDAPSFPYPSGPRDYQKQAFENWKSNGQRGLFAMATGTGKTITALNCLLEIYKSRHYYKAIILVPTVTLVDQWKEECVKFHYSHIYVISNRNKDWRKEIAHLRLMEGMDVTGEQNSYIIIATYASFARENIFSELMSFLRKKLLFIADEAHNMGSKSIMNRLDAIHYIRRIGLSATPDRQFDDDGNNAIRKFFGAERQYTFEFSMREAIDKGFLCRYYYYPHLVRLTNDEMAAYMEISKKLAPMFNYHSGSFGKSDDILTALLLKRKRIIHKAVNKLTVFRDIIASRLQRKGNLKYTLVYVPEGNVTDAFNADNFDASAVDDDYTSHLIDTFTSVIREESPQTTVRKFTSDTQERELILRQFEEGDLEVLTSMKCLDEGVDVPRSEMAVFCASTGNPRQFIQRRGRILRQHPDKHYAVIHDLVVAPEIDTLAMSYGMERSLLGSELKRVRNFAQLSENADASLVELENVLDYYKLSIF